MLIKRIIAFIVIIISFGYSANFYYETKDQIEKNIIEKGKEILKMEESPLLYIQNKGNIDFDFLPEKIKAMGKVYTSQEFIDFMTKITKNDPFDIFNVKTISNKCNFIDSKNIVCDIVYRMSGIYINYGIQSDSTIHYKLVAKKINKKWKIIEQTIYDELYRNDEDFKNKKIKKNIIKPKNFNFPELRVNNFKSTKNIHLKTNKNTFFYYYRRDVVNYARIYAFEHNPDYHYYGKHDCTNFASQAVHEGGLPFYYGDKDDINSWYYDYYYWSYYQNVSRTWTIADSFFSFLVTRNFTRPVLNMCKLTVGDLIFADWEGDYKIDHTMIITDKKGCQLFLTYHSIDERDISFEKVKSKYLNAKYYGIHFQSVFDYDYYE